MMQKMGFLLLVLALCAALPGTARALEPEEVMLRQAQALETDELSDALPREAAELLRQAELTDSPDWEEGLAALWSAVRDRFGQIVTAPLRGVTAVVLCALLCGVVTAAVPERYAKACTLAGVLAVGTLSAARMGDFLGLGGNTVQQIHDFSTALLPCLAGASAAAGTITAAAAKYAAAMLFMNVLLTVQKSVILPVIYAYTAAGLSGAALGTDGLSGAANLLKWVAVTLMRGIVICFVIYLTVTGVITGSADAARLKLTKTAVSTALPVVGGILSDASETVLAGAQLLKNAVGVFGLLSAAAICALPFLRLGAHYLLYKAASVLASALGGGRMQKAVDTVSTAFGMILGLVGTAGVMLFLSVVSFMKAVT